MLKNTAGQRLVVLAWDTNTQTPKTGDAANITAKLSKDGGTYTATSDTNPTELEQGRYAFDLTQEETNCDRWHLIPVSATANVFASCEESSYTTTIRYSVNSSILGVIVSRNFQTTLEAYVGETYTHTITTVDADGNAVDCSGMTLEVVIEKLDRTDVVTIANASITKATTTVAFAVANTYHTTEANYRWALRRTDTGVVIMQGPYIVHYAADN